MIRQEILNIFRLQPGKKVRLKDHDAGWAQTKELKELAKPSSRIEPGRSWTKVWER